MSERDLPIVIPDDRRELLAELGALSCRCSWDMERMPRYHSLGFTEEPTFQENEIYRVTLVYMVSAELINRSRTDLASRITSALNHTRSFVWAAPTNDRYTVRIERREVSYSPHMDCHELTVVLRVLGRAETEEIRRERLSDRYEALASLVNNGTISPEQFRQEFLGEFPDRDERYRALYTPSRRQGRTASQRMAEAIRELRATPAVCSVKPEKPIRGDVWMAEEGGVYWFDGTNWVGVGEQRAASKGKSFEEEPRRLVDA